MPPLRPQAESEIASAGRKPWQGVWLQAFVLLGWVGQSLGHEGVQTGLRASPFNALPVASHMMAPTLPFSHQVLMPSLRMRIFPRLLAKPLVGQSAAMFPCPKYVRSAFCAMLTY